MGFWDTLGTVADYTPGVSNVKGAIQGNGWQALGGAGYKVAKNFSNATDNPQQPGVGAGAAVNPATLQRDPTSGIYYDPATGRSYTDPAGTQVVADPNLAQQTAANFQRAGGFFGKVGATDATLDAVNTGQNQLGATLDRTINDPNAPSVARAQLAQTTDANGRQILGTAAGVGGANAYDARRAALSTLAGANTAAVGNAAVLRQKEVADATGARGALLGQQGQQAQARQNTNVGAGIDLAKTASGAQTSQQGLNQKTDAENQQKDQKYLGAGLSFLGGLG